MIEIEAYCQECGKTFTKRRSNQRYCCEECCRLGTLRRNRASYNRRYAEAKKKGKGKKKKLSTLAEINQLARDAGMTYGKYMALQYGKLVRVRRKE